MSQHRIRAIIAAGLLATAAFTCAGCASKRQQVSDAPPAQVHDSPPMTTHHQASLPEVRLVSHQQPQPEHDAPEPLAPTQAEPIESLPELEDWAIMSNPSLRRMQQEAGAQWAKLGYVDKLPDPVVSSMFFGDAMNFVPDRQLAELQVMQMIPWLSRLQAEAQRAYLEALAAENLYQAERLRVVGDVRAAWYKLYVLGKQIETTEADQEQLQSLIKTANARIATGDSQPGDVLMATLELSSLQEQLLGYRQQLVATGAELNRLVGRDVRIPVLPPTQIEAELPQWDHDLLRTIAMQTQPELAAARMRTAATLWGIEVARLKRRPDLSFGAGWMVMTADPADPMPDAGKDAWTLNLNASLPIGREKYDAMVREASREHYAAHASEEEIAQRLDAMLRDLWEQARVSHQTVQLYEQTILPQARQTFEADQKSLVNNTVSFDRVIRDYRTLLNLELGYHRALGQLATTLARIRQAVGVDLLATPNAE